MTTKTKTDQTLQHQVIDSCLLGRPVHLLPLFAAQLREDLAGAMRLPMSRRYWGGHQVDAVTFSRAGADQKQLRWINFEAGPNTVGFAIERKVLLGVLNHRYGRKGAVPPAVPDPATVRVTATEERLAVLLGQQLAATLATRVRANIAAQARCEPAAPAEFEAQTASTPAQGAWLIGIDVSAVHGGEQGRFWLALDTMMMTDVLHGLKAERKRARKALRNIAPLATHLQLRLDGRLVSKEVSLGALFDLRVGDVIPVSLSRTDVLLEDSRLFTAAVSEHKGKLCLTCFEDAE